MLNTFALKDLKADLLLNLWEKGVSSPSYHRALLMLEAFLPGYSMDSLKKLSLGQTNGLLFEICKHISKEPIQSSDNCPSCREKVGYEVSIDALTNQSMQAELDLKPFVFNFKDYIIEAQALFNEDLLRAQSCETGTEIRKMLINQCILQVKKGKKFIPINELPEQVIQAVSKQITQKDYLSETTFNLSCHNCKNQWSFSFDIKEYLWDTIQLYTQSLLEAVHQLAFAYGWSEQAIIGLPTYKRNFYLQKVACI